MRNPIFTVVLALSFLATCCTAQAEDSSKNIVFVCEHGSVKSLIAASFFNRMATEQKLGYRAVARGTDPQEAVPAAVASNLKKDGFSVASFKPLGLTKKDTEHAAAIIAFCEVPKELAAPAKVSSWLDVPPASVDYEKAKVVMLPHIALLIAELKRK